MRTGVSYTHPIYRVSGILLHNMLCVKWVFRVFPDSCQLSQETFERQPAGPAAELEGFDLPDPLEIHIGFEVE